MNITTGVFGYSGLNNVTAIFVTWPKETTSNKVKCTHSRVVGLRLEGNSAESTILSLLNAHISMLNFETKIVERRYETILGMILSPLPQPNPLNSEKIRYISGYLTSLRPRGHTERKHDTNLFSLGLRY